MQIQFIKFCPSSAKTTGDTLTLIREAQVLESHRPVPKFLYPIISKWDHEFSYH